jgi:protein-tyrosine phosphatase
MYDQLDLRAVYDLRGDVERAERPNPVPSRNLPVLSRAPDDDSAITFDGTTAGDGERVLQDLYCRHIQYAAKTIGELFAALARADSPPAVFHCHAGKDRTGVVAALLLEALGVGRDDVLDDYDL